MDLLQGLNSAQIESVCAVDGPVLVLAGPGSGKTRVLTHRIAYLIGPCGVSPHSILAVTFTNKASREMRTRIENLIGPQARQLTVGTFHAVCVRILRQESARLDLARSFAIYDDDDQLKLVGQLLKKLNLDPKQYKPRAVHSAISRAKNEMLGPETYRPPTYWHEAVARVFKAYEEALHEANALDFDDLLLKTAEMFQQHDDIRIRYQQRYSHILVDEFQDTNKAQYEIVLSLAGQQENVFVVGDEDQSIYSWRGADFRNVMRFRQDFPQAKLFLLEQNYRSTGTILDAAQAIISRNAQRHPKELWTEQDRGPLIRMFEAFEEREEAEFVVGEINRLVAQDECDFGDCAVMFRTNAQSRALEESLMRHAMPYKLIGATRFYQRREIKDVLGYLRLIHNPDDTISLTRVIGVPNRGIGVKTLDGLAAWAAGEGLSMGSALLYLAELAEEPRQLARIPFTPRARKLLLGFGQMLARLIEAQETSTLSELLTQVLEQTRLLEYLDDGTEEGQDRANNVREMYSVTDGFNQVEPETALAQFLEEVALVADTDQLDDVGNAVTLLTLHTAKGLEFHAVFMVGMEEGMCPHSRSLDDADAMEEERRLCYVGVTRAKRRLYLIRAFRRTIYGSSDVREPSRFLRDIPSSLTQGNIVPKRPSSQWGNASSDRRPFSPNRDKRRW